MTGASKIRGLSDARRQGTELTAAFLILLAFCSFDGRLQADDGAAGAAAAQTSIYVFVPDESTMVRTGGIAGLLKSYSIKGRFRLTADFGAGTASFSQVDAILTDQDGVLYAQSLDAVFNTTGLAGTVIDDTTIAFEGKTADGTQSDVRLKLTFSSDSVQLTGQTTPPPNSADMFFYDIEAITSRKYGGGAGEPNTPFLIGTAAHINAIGAEPNDWDKHFKLVADIDLRCYKGTDFNIIGYYDAGYQDVPFTGIFDGNGHTISNFTYASTDVNSVALFAHVQGRSALIKNLGLIDPNIDAGIGSGVAPLIDWLSEGVVSECYARGGSVSGNGWVAGLVAYNSGTITGCYSTAAISGQADVGGLAGYNDGVITGCSSISSVTGGNAVGGLLGSNDGTITGCSSTGDVIGNFKVGGLAGYNRFGTGTIRNSSSAGPVTGISDVAGLVGRNYGVVSSCRSTGEVSGSLYVGGLVGFHRGSVANCYSAANVHGGSKVGGLVGSHEGAIRNCYSSGRVAGDLYAGGLVGVGLPQDAVASFWDIETSGQTTSAGGMGKTTTEMQTAGTFLDAGWDFIGESQNGTDDIWRILEGRDYPRLWWEAAGQSNGTADER